MAPMRPPVECLQGKATYYLEAAALTSRVAAFRHVLLDLGTGDGRFALAIARADPSCLVIGVDACREGLRRLSRTYRADNAIFVIANALALPPALGATATRVVMNFPYGSLLRGLTEGEPALFTSLHAVTRSGAIVACRLNGGALAEAGHSFDGGVERVQQVLRASGYQLARPASTELDASALRALPSTWAKRIAFGRDPRGVCIVATRDDGSPPVAKAPCLEGGEREL